MKIQAFLKIAVVAMAAFGAYAFSGNANSQQMFTRSDNCQNVTVGCANDGQFVCRIKINEKLTVPIMDLECEELIYHTSNIPFEW